jgi:anti-sigma factor RsiW
MIDRQTPVTEDELHAFVDGELAADRQDAVEAWLLSHPDDAARIATWRTQADLIRARFAGVAEDQWPARFDLDRLQRADRRWRWAAGAAVVAAFLLGGVSGWFIHGPSDTAPPAVKSAAVEALDAHKLYVVEVRHPVEVPGGESAHLVQWLSKRLGFALQAPDLGNLGLKLVGGRLLPGDSAPAGFLMYEGASGERFTLYCVRSTTPDTALRYRAAGSVAAFYWVNDDVVHVISGPSDRDRLKKVAEAVYNALDTRSASRDPSL